MRRTPEKGLGTVTFVLLAVAAVLADGRTEGKTG
jgi:hypothetical protein